MKKQIIILIILLLIVIPSAFSVRIYFFPEEPIVFEPGLSTSFSYEIFNNLGIPFDVTLYVKGDLAKYITLDQEYYENLLPGQRFQLKAELDIPPDAVSTPGIHSIMVGALEERNPGNKNGVGARAAVEVRIKVRVRYPGEYIEASLYAPHVRVGGNSNLRVTVSNFGSENLDEVKATITIFDVYNNTVKTLETNGISLKVDAVDVISADFNTSGYPKGPYHAIADVYYGSESLKTNKADFKIGDINVLVTDFTREITLGGIVPFNISVKSEWNSFIEEVYAEVDLFQKGRNVHSFKTPFLNLKAWEEKKLIGYVQSDFLKSGEHDVNITLHFAGGSTLTKGQVEVLRGPRLQFAMNTTSMIFLVVIFLLVSINIFWFLYFRRRKNEEFQ